MTRILLRLISLLVPHAVRPRWREEWRAEMDHAAGRGLSVGARVAMAAGTLPDALAARRLVSEAGRSRLPRAGIFHGLAQDLRYALRRVVKSLVAYVVALRRREIGIRMTLGADGSAVVAMILRQALIPTAAGCLAGAAAAAVVAQIVRSQVFDASPLDPLAFAGAAAVMVVVMAFASAGPAYRASRVDPMTVLRQE